MGHKKEKDKYGGRSYGVQPQPVLRHKKKNRFSTGMKLLFTIFLVLIVGGVVYWQFSSSPTQSTQQQYPLAVTGSVYSDPVVEASGTKVSVPYSFVDSKKLVFLDLKLQNTTSEITYQGRSIPLSLYRGGQYLPLIIISTPTQKVISGIRVCEPCSSFSFHIVQGKYLDCDSCHTKWDIETLLGKSGGCLNYPPPRLTTAVSSNVEVDLSPLGMKVT